jgi:hypothetical protein
MFAKTECPVSREQFVANAKSVQVTIGGVPMLATVKQFQTGSLGWYLTGKTTVEIDGVAVPVQIGVTLTCIGSKELPKESKTAA